jgi:hypothetical protein
VRRHLLALKGLWVRQTAAKFRVQAAAQKYATYDRLWQRTMQEIEAGTYQRDLQRVKRRHPKEAAKAEIPAGTPAGAIPPTGPTPAAARPPSPPATEPAPPRAPPVVPSSPGPALPPRVSPVVPPVAAPAALSDQTLRGVYDAYLQAKKRCNEDTSKLNFEQLAQTLRRQAPELMKKHQAQAIEFKVVIKDGKALLRAVPKSG